MSTFSSGGPVRKDCSGIGSGVGLPGISQASGLEELPAAGGRIGDESNSIVVAVPGVELPNNVISVFAAAPGFIINVNQATLVSNVLISDSAGQAKRAAAGIAQTLGLEELGCVDWSAYDIDVSLFGVVDPGVQLPSDQIEDKFGMNMEPKPAT